MTVNRRGNVTVLLCDGSLLCVCVCFNAKRVTRRVEFETVNFLVFAHGLSAAQIFITQPDQSIPSPPILYVPAIFFVVFLSASWFCT